jgi:hypothetical protein
VTLSADTVGRYGLLEISFDLFRKYRNPFDPASVEVDGVFTGPDGGTTVMPGFFYKPFTRRMIKGKEVLAPDGRSGWKIRFTPLAEGKYGFTVRVRDAQGTYSSEKHSFTCIPSELPGFVRTAGDNTYLEFSDGSFFYPVGMTIRSPSDTREPYRYPFRQYTGYGTYAYDLFFDELGKHGINWARVWMCSWWCGLEWREDWGSYGGIGFYNMENAWRFDHVLDRAREKGIYLQVDTTNHGMLSTGVDREWHNNPFNERIGGFLDRPEDYFTSPRARQAHRNRMRYTIARWGYSPNIMSFGILTEVEFTGEYHRYAAKHNDKSGSYPKTTDWHRDIPRYIKEIDPYDHLIQTHFSHPQRGSDIWSLAEMEICESNAYSAFQQWRKYRLGRHGAGVVTAVDNYYYSLFKKYGKPVLIGEFGGHWSTNSAKLLNSELHCGTWASLMTPLAGATGYWWWPHVHFNDLYHEYGNAVQFMKGEDLRKYAFRRAQLDTPGSPRLESLALSGRGAFWAWIHDPRIVARHIRTHRNRPIEQYTEYFGQGISHTGRTFMLPAQFRSKKGTIEFWNTYTGTIMETRSIEPGGPAEIRLPDFKNDIAVKIYAEGVKPEGTRRLEDAGRGSTAPSRAGPTH